MKAFGMVLWDVAALGIGFLLTRWVLRQSTPAKDLQTAIEFFQPARRGVALAVNRMPVWFNHTMGIDTVYLARLKHRVARGLYSDDNQADGPDSGLDCSP